MRQTAFAFAAAALVAAVVLLPPPPASARCYGCGVAAGVVGGVAAGAIIGSAIAGSQPVYVAPPPPPPSEVYYDEPDHPVCHVEHRRYFEEGFGWRSRRVEVCE
jgi:hypothetical protein